MSPNEDQASLEEDSIIPESLNLDWIENLLNWMIIYYLPLLQNILLIKTDFSLVNQFNLIFITAKYS